MNRKLLFISLLFFSLFKVQSQSCYADFQFNVNGLSVQFMDSSFTQSSAINSNWDFGDGNYSSQLNPNHTYLNSGNYNVCHIIYDSLCIDTICKQVTVTNPNPCQASFIYNLGVNGGVTFTNTSSSNGFLIYDWNFGDSSFSSLENPIHTYTATGKYIVSLKILDTLSICNSIFNDTLDIFISPNCKPDFNYSINGDTVFIQNKAVSFNRVKYLFGDGDTSYQSNPFHIYQQSGTYTIKQLIYNDTTNCVDSLSKSITINISNSCLAKYIVALDTNNTSTLFLINVSSGGANHEYLWDFGDGTTSNAILPIHQYTNNQAYQICLTVTDSVMNCISTYCDTVGLDSNGNILKSSGFTLKVLDGMTIGFEDLMLKDHFKIYPNPTKSSFTIDQTNLIDHLNYQILSIDGVLILEGKINQKVQSIDINDYSNGMYFIRIFNESGSITKKIIKN